MVEAVEARNEAFSEVFANSCAFYGFINSNHLLPHELTHPRLAKSSLVYYGKMVNLRRILRSPGIPHHFTGPSLFPKSWGTSGRCGLHRKVVGR